MSTAKRYESYCDIKPILCESKSMEFQPRTYYSEVFDPNAGKFIKMNIIPSYVVHRL
jgi:hypothetical protein